MMQFHGEYRWLSNFFLCRVEFEGLVFDTVENAYQAAKCANREDRARFQSISAVQAKRLGRVIEMRSDWDDVKVAVMSNLLQQKFTQPWFREKLLETGTMEIVEGNGWRDMFWGVCIRTGKGKNTLGRLIMSIRDGLQS